MLEQITIPRFLRGGIGPNHVGFHGESFRLFGADCETVNGKPLTVQIHDGKDTVLLWVDRHNVWDAFIRHMRKVCRSRVNVMFFHYLSYDMTVLSYPFFKEYGGLAEPKPFEKRGRGWRLRVWFGKRWWARVWLGDRTLWILDSWAFVFTSLEKIANTLKLPFPKLPKPEYLGEREPTDKERPAFEEYAKRDALIAYHVGKWILEQHREFDVKMCVSLPQFASRVLRHHFFKDDEKITLPSLSVCRNSVLSYHGGKNGCYVKPGWFKRVYEADLTSAYAWAMSVIPQFVRGRYSYVRELRGHDQPGIYKISGSVSGCRYPAFFDHAFRPVRGAFREIWVTGYELHEALRCREVRLKSLTGIVWMPEKGYAHNPLREYIDTFYKRKEEAATDDPRRSIYKLLCNSLYGKFIQHIKTDTPSVFMKANGEARIEDHTFTAGGLFQPFIGSLITGLVRARIHSLEVRYNALHTATDSIKTKEKVEESEGLGGLRIVAYGPCLILRNKLYVHFDEDMNIAKYALHGFQGTVKELLAMVKEKRTTYTHRHMWKLKEALRSDKEPLMVEEQKRVLAVDMPKNN